MYAGFCLIEVLLNISKVNFYPGASPIASPTMNRFSNATYLLKYICHLSLGMALNSTLWDFPYLVNTILSLIFSSHMSNSQSHPNYLSGGFLIVSSIRPTRPTFMCQQSWDCPIASLRWIIELMRSISHSLSEPADCVAVICLFNCQTNWNKQAN